ncbi:MAG: M48 family metallopeptidase [Pirellulaceae bacterium]|nr:M48 family metallopeptidase [Pirellulaceae bacterium]
MDRRRALQTMGWLSGTWMSGGLLLCGCRTAPITGRKQLLLMPEENEVALGLSAYEEVVNQETPSSNGQYIELVNRVGHRLAEVSGRPDYKWEFRVLASDQMNAFCLPGGKVAIYEGILPVCANEAGLAVVMSHEVAHALARHGGERMSQNYAVDGVKQAVNYVLQKHEQQQREMVLKAYGVASEYGVILPYSRKHESEADHMGLMMMSRAGYDPAEAPQFWLRFAAMTAGTKPPEFLSTHPSDERRSRDLQALLPEAGALYEQAAQRYGSGEILLASHMPPQPAGGHPAAGPGFVPGYFPTTGSGLLPAGPPRPAHMP